MQKTSIPAAPAAPVTDADKKAKAATPAEEIPHFMLWLNGGQLQMKSAKVSNLTLIGWLTIALKRVQDLVINGPSITLPAAPVPGAEGETETKAPAEDKAPETAGAAPGSENLN